MPTPKIIGTGAITIRYDGTTAIGLKQTVGLNATPGLTDEVFDETGKVRFEDRRDWRSAVTVAYVPYGSVKFPIHNSIVQATGWEDSVYNGAYRVEGVGEEYSIQGRPAKNLTLIRYLDNGIPSSTTTTTTTTTTT